MIKRETLDNSHMKSVRSFVAREGRATAAHKAAMHELWPKYSLNLQPGMLDFGKIFGRNAPLVFEIGFGDGSSLLQMAQQNLDKDFIGVEVYKTGISKLLSGVNGSGLTNVRVFCADAVEVLENCIPDNSLHQVLLFFPDPWPKARHHKRRLVQPKFVQLLHDKLQVAGCLHMATDWENYAQHMLEVMEQAAGWENVAGAGYIARPSTRLLTKFEKRGQSLGYGTWDLMFRKSAHIVI